jgi:hypothetical protein
MVSNRLRHKYLVLHCWGNEENINSAMTPDGRQTIDEDNIRADAIAQTGD